MKGTGRISSPSELLLGDAEVTRLLTWLPAGAQAGAGAAAPAHVPDLGSQEAFRGLSGGWE